MSNIKKSLTELIGNTPMLELTNYNKNNKLKCKIIAKLEYFNPLGSVKDRAAYNMIVDGEKKNLINSETVIIEPTSGNTGIGLAFVAATKGYKLILTMPDTMSIERRKLLSALGAEVVLTSGKEGMKGAINKALELKNKYRNSYIPQQFENPANPDAHRNTTAVELLRDTDGNIDIFVSAVGTGGTLTGVGETLKKEIKNIKIVAVEPEKSPVISNGDFGAHKIQGIGAGFVPKNLNIGIIDEIIKISDEDAYKITKEIAKSDGLLVGISSGAAIAAATQLAKKEENRGKNIVVILPDTGERYLSSDVF